MTDRTGFRFGAHVMKSENVSSSTAALALPGRGLKSQAYVDHDELSSPPPSDAEGRILRVDFRYTLFFVGSINTRDCTATIKFGVVLYWTDSRLAGFESAILPATLWGPDLYLRNGVGGVLKECEQFAVTDVAIGRLKRILNFEATIVLPMDLSAFPFDTQSVRPELVSISHWSQCAGPRFGSLAHGQSYTLHPVSRANEGRLIWMMWDGRMPEWELHSYAIQTVCSHHLAGFVLMLLCLDLYVTRKHGFYFEKVLLPLIALTYGSFLLHLVPPQDIQDRMNGMFTLFLAAFALLYVITDHLPRLDFLTAIDKAVYLTLGTLLWLGLESWIVYRIHESEQLEATRAVEVTRGSMTLASRVDAILCWSVFVLYSMSMGLLFLPGYTTMKATVQEMSVRLADRQYTVDIIDDDGNADIFACGLVHGGKLKTGLYALDALHAATTNVVHFAKLMRGIVGVLPAKGDSHVSDGHTFHPMEQGDGEDSGHRSLQTLHEARHSQVNAVAFDVNSRLSTQMDMHAFSDGTLPVRKDDRRTVA